MRWLKKLLEQLDAGSSVLDLGCGSGDPADVEIVKAEEVESARRAGIRVLEAEA